MRAESACQADLARRKAEDAAEQAAHDEQRRAGQMQAAQAAVERAEHGRQATTRAPAERTELNRVAASTRDKLASLESADVIIPDAQPVR